MKHQTMHRGLIFTLLLTMPALCFAQAHKGKCGIEIQDVSSITTFGYLSAYTVMFKNTNEKSVDGIYYTAIFYNNEDREIQRIEDSFNSSSLVDPLAPGVTKSLIRSPAVKGASKMFITVDRVHFTSGKTCK